MYSIAHIINSKMAAKEHISMISQIAVFTYTNIKYRQKKIKIDVRLLKDYGFQTIVTCVTDLTYYYLIAQGVNHVIDYKIIVLVILMLIGRKLKLDKIEYVGIGMLLVGFCIMGLLG